MDQFELEIKSDFIKEATILLEEVESAFMDLESSENQVLLLDKIFRLAHNLKGGARAVGFGDVAELTHQLESLILKIQNNEIELNSQVVTVLLHSNDRLVQMLTELQADFFRTFDNKDILSDLQNCMSAVTGVAATEPEPLPKVPSSEMFEPDSVSLPVENPSAATVSVGIPEIETATAARTEKVKENSDELIRVNLSKINLLNNWVGELIVLQSVIQQQCYGSNEPQLLTAIRQITKLSKDIQSLSMSLRMLPVKPLTQKLLRVTRDTANALHKEVTLQINGEHMDVDKSVLDQVVDPLIHILRNAIDHGLELPEERGTKAPQGLVIVSFFNQGNFLVIEIKDDGKGIDTEVLRRKAIEKRLITENQSLSEKQLINLIFHPGFSTKSQTSEISGRGVGMDVVKTNIEALGGSVDVQTKIGFGSLFKLQIPLSLAVVDGLVVASRNGRYVVPINQIQETVNLRTLKVHTNKTGIGSCFELRGNVVPLLFLEDAIGEKTNSPAYEGTALIVNVGDRPVALGVADIIRAQQIVVKPFCKGIEAQKGWVGTCVLGDGLPTLILSPVDLLSGKFNYQFEKSVEKSA